MMALCPNVKPKFYSKSQEAHVPHREGIRCPFDSAPRLVGCLAIHAQPVPGQDWTPCTWYGKVHIACIAALLKPASDVLSPFYQCIRYTIICVSDLSRIAVLAVEIPKLS